MLYNIICMVVRGRVSDDGEDDGAATPPKPFEVKPDITHYQ